MNTALPDDRELQRMQSAADWLVRLSDAPTDEGIVAEWSRWCQEDAANLPAFKRAQAIWEAAVAPQCTATVRGSSGHSRRRSSRVPWALAASLLLVVSTVSWLLYSRNMDNGAQSYSTPVASLGSSELPDGSRVELGARSRITTHYTARLRAVSVDEGEAYFKVMKDPVRPFIVTAGGVAVTAIGTEFNVRHAGERVIVTVREGKVQVSGTSASAMKADGSALQPVALEAGRQAVFSIPARHVALAPVSPADAASWRQGVLKYENEPLSGVIADLSRYSSERIVVVDPEIGRRPFTGTIFSAQIPQALSALQDVFPLHVVRRDGEIRLESR